MSSKQRIPRQKPCSTQDLNMLFWSQSLMLGPSNELRISSIEEQHNTFDTMPGVVAL